MKRPAPDEAYTEEEYEEYSEDYAYVEDDGDYVQSRTSGAVVFLGAAAAVCLVLFLLILAASFLLPSLKSREQAKEDPDAFLHGIRLEEEAERKENPLLPEEETEATQETSASRKQNTKTVIHLRAAGDLNITNSVVEAGLAATGYDFTRAFMDVAPVLAGADLTVMNLEGGICGDPYGSARASAPREILQGLRSAGVDLVQTANSYSIFNGLIGMSSTLRALEEAGLQGVGAFATDSDYRKSGGYTIVETQGVKVAFVAFTKGLGGMGMPAGSENLVNLLYEDYDSTYRTIAKDSINKTLDRVNAQKPDIVVALLHWGSEYNNVISDSQKNIVSLLQKKGVDVILGTHSHLVQQVEYDPLTGNFVAYSLGDFFGDGVRGGSNYSIILDLEITKDTDLSLIHI